MATMLSPRTKTLYVIDGYGFIFRAFYAVPNLTAPDGTPIGAVYGFFKMLISLINTAKPTHLVVALDTGKRTFRNDLYDDFLEAKALKELLKVAEYKAIFDEKNISFEDIQMTSSPELVDLFELNRDAVIKMCDEYNFDLQNPPKMLLILMFLGIADNVKIEECKTQYKANRRETPDELKVQFKIIRELIDAMGIVSESVIGHEADDVIATLATQAIKNGFQSVVVSADKDLCQLVKNGEIEIYDPSKKISIDEQGVIEKFGVPVWQVKDYLSIVGDHCDNVFGVNGIGPKGAIKLLQKYGTIENILLHLDELDDKTRQKFIDSQDVLLLAGQLVALKYDAMEVSNFDKYLLEINNDRLREFIVKYGFKNIEQIGHNVKKKQNVEAIQKGLF